MMFSNNDTNNINNKNNNNEKHDLNNLLWLKVLNNHAPLPL